MRRSLAYVLTIAVATGCGDSRPASTTDLPFDTVVAVPVVLIGRAEGDPAYLFGDVSSVAVSPSTVLIADRIGATVRSYDLAGSYIGTIGSQGEGPGEFEFPNDLALDLQGRLFVRDYRRISVFATQMPDGIPDSLVMTIPLTGPGTPWSARGRIIGGQYYRPTYLFRDGERQRYFYILYDSVGATGDTLPVPRLPGMEHLGQASFLIGGGVGRNLVGVSRAPFEPRAVWDVTPRGTVVSSTGDDGMVIEWGTADDTLRVVRFPVEQSLVDRSEYEDSLEAFQSRIDSIPVPFDQIRGMSAAARSGRLPTTLPAALALHVDDHGDIWIRRWPQRGRRDHSVFDVIMTRDGSVHTVVVGADLQLDPPPFVSSQFIAGVVVDPATGVERVAVYRVPGR